MIVDFLDIYIVFAATFFWNWQKKLRWKKSLPAFREKVSATSTIHHAYTCLFIFHMFVTVCCLGVSYHYPSLHVGENLQLCNVIWSSGFVVVYTGSPGVKSCVSGVSFGATSSQTYSALTWAFWLNISWDLGFGESLKKLMPNWMC